MKSGWRSLSKYRAAVGSESMNLKEDMPMASEEKRTTVFLVRLRADRDDSSVRALRWLLKRALREFGMTALSVTEEVEQKERADDRAA
jgi:hypothetical protein